MPDDFWATGLVIKYLMSAYHLNSIDMALIIPYCFGLATF